nr:hypothetical protein [Saccharopolyspora sp. HNM0983]
MLVLVVLGVTVAAVALWPLVHARDDTAGLRPAVATVVEPAPCGTRTAGDLLDVHVDGDVRSARYDGCGHLAGQRLDVLVPAQDRPGARARPVAAGVSEQQEAAARAHWVLLTLASVSGGCYGLLLSTRR